MKIFLLLAGIFAAFGIFISVYTWTPCDTPIKYHIDSVDPKFNLSREELVKDVVEAAQIWDKAYGKDLFIEDPAGRLSINMVYDERQTLDTKISNLENQLQNQKQSLDPQIAQYEQLAAEFKTKLDALNSEIASWNAKGGAPPDVYQQLKQQSDELKVEADRLNAMAKSLNLSTQNYNSNVGNLNNTITNFNSALAIKPEEGVYIGKSDRIEIYFNVNHVELIRTLTHELGHARGLEHVSNPEAIMYKFTNQQNTLTPDDQQELDRACQKRPIKQILLERILSLTSLDKAV